MSSQLGVSRLTRAARLPSVTVAAPRNAFRGGWGDTFRSTVLTQLLQHFNQQGSAAGWTYIDYNAGPDKWDISRSVRRQWGINPVFDYGRAMSVLRHKDQRVFMGHPFLSLMRRVREVNADDDENRLGGTATDATSDPGRLSKLVPGFRYFPSVASLLKPVMRAQDRCVLVEKDPEYFRRLQQYVGDDHRFRLLNLDAYQESGVRSERTGLAAPLSIPQRIAMSKQAMQAYLQEVERSQATSRQEWRDREVGSSDPRSRFSAAAVKTPELEAIEQEAAANVAAGRPPVPPAYLQFEEALKKDTASTEAVLQYLGLQPRPLLAAARPGQPELRAPLPIIDLDVQRSDFSTDEEHALAVESARILRVLSARKSRQLELLEGSLMSPAQRIVKARLDAVRAEGEELRGLTKLDQDEYNQAMHRLFSRNERALLFAATLHRRVQEERQERTSQNKSRGDRQEMDALIKDLPDEDLAEDPRDVEPPELDERGKPKPPDALDMALALAEERDEEEAQLLDEADAESGIGLDNDGFGNYMDEGDPAEYLEWVGDDNEGEWVAKESAWSLMRKHEIDDELIEARMREIGKEEARLVDLMNQAARQTEQVIHQPRATEARLQLEDWKALLARLETGSPPDSVTSLVSSAKSAAVAEKTALLEREIAAQPGVDHSAMLAALFPADQPGHAKRAAEIAALSEQQLTQRIARATRSDRERRLHLRIGALEQRMQPQLAALQGALVEHGDEYPAVADLLRDALQRLSLDEESGQRATEQAKAQVLMTLRAELAEVQAQATKQASKRAAAIVRASGDAKLVLARALAAEEEAVLRAQLLVQDDATVTVVGAVDALLHAEPDAMYDLAQLLEKQSVTAAAVEAAMISILAKHDQPAPPADAAEQADAMRTALLDRVAQELRSIEFATAALVDDTESPGAAAMSAAAAAEDDDLDVPTQSRLPLSLHEEKELRLATKEAELRSDKLREERARGQLEALDLRRAALLRMEADLRRDPTLRSPLPALLRPTRDEFTATVDHLYTEMSQLAITMRMAADPRVRDFEEDFDYVAPSFETVEEVTEEEIKAVEEALAARDAEVEAAEKEDEKEDDEDEDEAEEDEQQQTDVEAKEEEDGKVEEEAAETETSAELEASIKADAALIVRAEIADLKTTDALAVQRLVAESLEADVRDLELLEAMDSVERSWLMLLQLHGVRIAPEAKKDLESGRMRTAKSTEGEVRLIPSRHSIDGSALVSPSPITIASDSVPCVPFRTAASSARWDELSATVLGLLRERPVLDVQREDDADEPKAATDAKDKRGDQNEIAAALNAEEDPGLAWAEYMHEALQQYRELVRSDKLRSSASVRDALETRLSAIGAEYDDMAADRLEARAASLTAELDELDRKALEPNSDEPEHKLMPESMDEIEDGGDEWAPDAGAQRRELDATTGETRDVDASSGDIADQVVAAIDGEPDADAELLDEEEVRLPPAMERMQARLMVALERNVIQRELTSIHRRVDAIRKQAAVAIKGAATRDARMRALMTPGGALASHTFEAELRDSPSGAPELRARVTERELLSDAAEGERAEQEFEPEDVESHPPIRNEDAIASDSLYERIVLPTQVDRIHRWTRAQMMIDAPPEVLEAQIDPDAELYEGPYSEDPSIIESETLADLRVYPNGLVAVDAETDLPIEPLDLSDPLPTGDLVAELAREDVRLADLSEAANDEAQQRLDEFPSTDEEVAAFALDEAAGDRAVRDLLDQELDEIRAEQLRQELGEDKDEDEDEEMEQEEEEDENDENDAGQEAEEGKAEEGEVAVDATQLREPTVLEEIAAEMRIDVATLRKPTRPLITVPEIAALAAKVQAELDAAEPEADKPAPADAKEQEAEEEVDADAEVEEDLEEVTLDLSFEQLRAVRRLIDTEEIDSIEELEAAVVKQLVAGDKKLTADQRDELAKLPISEQRSVMVKRIAFLKPAAARLAVEMADARDEEQEFRDELDEVAAREQLGRELDDTRDDFELAADEEARATLAEEVRQAADRIRDARYHEALKELKRLTAGGAAAEQKDGQADGEDEKEDLYSLPGVPAEDEDVDAVDAELAGKPPLELDRRDDGAPSRQPVPSPAEMAMRTSLATEVQAELLLQRVRATLDRMTPAEFARWKVAELEAELARSAQIASADEAARQRDADKAEAVRQWREAEDKEDAAILAAVSGPPELRPSLEQLRVFLYRARLSGRYGAALPDDLAAPSLANPAHLLPSGVLSVHDALPAPAPEDAEAEELRQLKGEPAQDEAGLQRELQERQQDVKKREAELAARPGANGQVNPFEPELLRLKEALFQVQRRAFRSELREQHEAAVARAERLAAAVPPAGSNRVFYRVRRVEYVAPYESRVPSHLSAAQRDRREIVQRAWLSARLAASEPGRGQLPGLWRVEAWRVADGQVEVLAADAAEGQPLGQAAKPQTAELDAKERERLLAYAAANGGMAPTSAVAPADSPLAALLALYRERVSAEVARARRQAEALVRAKYSFEAPRFDAVFESAEQRSEREAREEKEAHEAELKANGNEARAQRAVARLRARRAEEDAELRRVQAGEAPRPAPSASEQAAIMTETSAMVSSLTDLIAARNKFGPAEADGHVEELDELHADLAVPLSPEHAAAAAQLRHQLDALRDTIVRKRSETDLMEDEIEVEAAAQEPFEASMPDVPSSEPLVSPVHQPDLAPVRRVPRWTEMNAEQQADWRSAYDELLQAAKAHYETDVSRLSLEVAEQLLRDTMRKRDPQVLRARALLRAQSAARLAAAKAALPAKAGQARQLAEAELELAAQEPLLTADAEEESTTVLEARLAALQRRQEAITSRKSPYAWALLGGKDPSERTQREREEDEALARIAAAEDAAARNGSSDAGVRFEHGSASLLGSGEPVHEFSIELDSEPKKPAGASEDADADADADAELDPDVQRAFETAQREAEEAAGVRARSSEPTLAQLNPPSASTHAPVSLAAALARPLTSHAIVGIDVSELCADGVGLEGDIAGVDEALAHATAKILQQSVQRFPHATYVITYPIYGRAYADELLAACARTGVRQMLQATFHLQKGAPYDGAARAYDFEPWGAGVVVLRPPPGFEKTLKDVVGTLQQVLIGYGPSIHTAEEEEAVSARRFPAPDQQAMATFFVDRSLHHADGWPARPDVSWLTSQVDEHVSSLNAFRWEHFAPNYDAMRSRRFEVLARARTELESDLFNYSRGYRGDDEEATRWTMHNTADTGSHGAGKARLTHDERIARRQEKKATAQAAAAKAAKATDKTTTAESAAAGLHRHSKSADDSVIRSVDWGMVHAQRRALERLTDAQLATARDAKRTQVFGMLSAFQKTKLAEAASRQQQEQQAAAQVAAAKAAGTYREPTAGDAAAAASSSSAAAARPRRAKRQSLAQQMQSDAAYQQLLARAGQHRTSQMGQRGMEPAPDAATAAATSAHAAQDATGAQRAQP